MSMIAARLTFPNLARSLCHMMRVTPKVSNSPMGNALQTVRHKSAPCTTPTRGTPASVCGSAKTRARKPKKKRKTDKISNRDQCTRDELPTCSEKRLAKSACMKEKARKKAMTKPMEKKLFKSMWENPECCNNPCPGVVPRFDELYYKIEDKGEREYMQTWVSCPKIKVLPKKMCCFDADTALPPIRRRPRHNPPKTACAQSEMALLNCMALIGRGPKCPKFSMFGCKPARETLECKHLPGPKKCKKFCAPYPAFSECMKPRFKPARPIECKCMELQPMCYVWDLLRKEKLMKGGDS